MIVRIGMRVRFSGTDCTGIVVGLSNEGLLIVEEDKYGLYLAEALGRWEAVEPAWRPASPSGRADRPDTVKEMA